MRLYQHSARCPVALRTFLDCNPNYWSFIPLKRDQAEEENRRYSRNPGTRLTTVTATNTTSDLDALIRQLANDYFDRIPIPPVRYEFSYQQQVEQKQFLDEFVSLPQNQLPYSPIDLYRYSIIALRKYKLSKITNLSTKIFLKHGLIFLSFSA